MSAMSAFWETELKSVLSVIFALTSRHHAPSRSIAVAVYWAESRGHLVPDEILDFTAGARDLLLAYLHPSGKLALLWFLDLSLY